MNTEKSNWQLATSGMLSFSVNPIIHGKNPFETSCSVCSWTSHKNSFHGNLQKGCIVLGLLHSQYFHWHPALSLMATLQDLSQWLPEIIKAWRLDAKFLHSCESLFQSAGQSTGSLYALEPTWQPSQGLIRRRIIVFPRCCAYASKFTAYW